jgi:hypothetical protein
MHVLQQPSNLSYCGDFTFSIAPDVAPLLFYNSIQTANYIGDADEASRHVDMGCCTNSGIKRAVEDKVESSGGSAGSNSILTKTVRRQCLLSTGALTSTFLVTTFGTFVHQLT